MMEPDKNPNDPVKWLIWGTLVLYILISIFQQSSADTKLNINYLGVSQHFGDSGATNQVHHGLGLSLSTNKTWEYGIMVYKNSFGAQSTLVSVTNRFYNKGLLSIGIMGGYVSGYGDRLKVPLAAALVIKYDWLVLSTIPGEVVALGISLPLLTL